MKHILLILLLVLNINVFSQKYISLSPSLFTNAGTFKERFTPTIEVGQQWKSFSLGFDVGKFNVTPQRGKDTTFYFEVRPNLNIFQQDKFTNTLTIGVCYVFNASESLLNELTTGIEYTPTDRLSYNVYVGTYYLSGSTSASNNNFFGISLMYFFTPYKH